MKGTRKRRLPGAAAALAAVALLLTTGASGGAAVTSPLVEAAEPVPYKAAPAAVKSEAEESGSGALPEEAGEPEPGSEALPEEAGEPEPGSGALPEDAGEPETVLPCLVPETEAVEDTYFDDAAFLGDSRTQGLFLYSGLKTGREFAAVGATVESVFTKKDYETQSGAKVPLLDAMKGQACGKVYIMLGMNELGWSKLETFHDQYARLIDRVREDHPEAKIALQSIPPVSAKQDAKKTYVNNERIRAYNEVVRALAEEKDCYFLDVAACFAGEDGVLPAKQTSDGVHFNTAGCRAWLDYLRTHSLEDDAIAAAQKAANA